MNAQFAFVVMQGFYSASQPPVIIIEILVAWLVKISTHQSSLRAWGSKLAFSKKELEMFWNQIDIFSRRRYDMDSHGVIGIIRNCFQK